MIAQIDLQHIIYLHNLIFIILSKLIDLRTKDHLIHPFNSPFNLVTDWDESTLELLKSIELIVHKLFSSRCRSMIRTI